MTTSQKQMIAARLARWERFLDMRQPAGHLVLIRLTKEPKITRPWPHPQNKTQRIEWAWGQYLTQLERLEWLDDDAIPHLDPYTGTEIFAEAFGCRAHRTEDNMPFALPLITQASEVARLKVPSLDTPCLNLLFEIADELRARGGPDALMRLVDIQSPMDIAALIWEKSSFYVACLEEPEAVRELAAKVKALLTTFLDAWFARYGTGFMAHYPDYYMPKGITLSEDEIGAVSTEVFEALFLPELQDLSRRYGAIGIHCCAHARHQWDGLKKVAGLKLLNFVQKVEVTSEAHECFAAHTAQMHNWYGQGDPATWLDQLPAGCRIVLQMPAETRERAAELAHLVTSQW